ncbi:MAG: electron transporter RnfG [Firmicutes bacterium HGW-Firmicutes-7]|nr:MAG: electron transporter RnfG [Firmicutes bacterium HGW-Firmicutes-7]
MKEIIKNALILFAITLVSSVLLAIAFQVTEEPISVQKIKQRDAAFATVIPDATFEEIVDLDFSEYEKIDSVYVAKKADEIIGYTFKLITNEGYSAGIEMVVGVSIEGTITGIDVMRHAETPGLGALADEADFKNQFVSKPLGELSTVKGVSSNDTQISAISGATITSKAVTNAVNEAVTYYNNELKEGN